MRLPTIHDSSSTAQLTNFLRFVHELLHTELQKGAQFTEKGRLDSFKISLIVTFFRPQVIYAFLVV